MFSHPGPFFGYGFFRRHTKNSYNKFILKCFCGLMKCLNLQFGQLGKKGLDVPGLGKPVKLKNMIWNILICNTKNQVA